MEGFLQEGPLKQTAPARGTGGGGLRGPASRSQEVKRLQDFISGTSSLIIWARLHGHVETSKVPVVFPLWARWFLNYLKTVIFIPFSWAMLCLTRWGGDWKCPIYTKDVESQLDNLIPFCFCSHKNLQGILHNLLDTIHINALFKWCIMLNSWYWMMWCEESTRWLVKIPSCLPIPHTLA